MQVLSNPGQPAGKSARPSSGRRQSQPQQQVQSVIAAAEQQPSVSGSITTQRDGLQFSTQSGRTLEVQEPDDVYMDRIIHKLQLLSYERDFCRRKKPHRKGLTPCYFSAVQPGLSGNEQFFYFTSLAVWLLRLCGVALPSPKEFDDPNITLQGIFQGLRALGFASPSYPPSKLAAGFGSEVCAVVDGLLDVALERKGLVKLVKATFEMEGLGEGEGLIEEEGSPEDEAADISSQAAAALLLAAEDSSQSAAALPALLQPSPNSGGQQASSAAAAAAAEAAAAKQALVSTVDPVAWKLEVERVAPKLRLSLSPDMRDWRQHLEVAHAHMASLAAAWPDVRSQLDQLGSEVAASLEKLEGREQQLNNQFEGLMGSYKDSRQQLTAMQAEFSRRTELISERNNELHRVAAALEDVKQQLENRGSNLSDASPLVRLKAAMASLREELKGMELRIGVVAHNLVSLSLQDKQAALQDAAKRHANDVDTANKAAMRQGK